MTMDLTGLAVAIIGGLFLVINTLALRWVQNHVKNETDKAVLSTALTNGLGMAQAAAEGAVGALHPRISIPGVPDALAPGVAYVLQHAGDEAARLGNTPKEIAEKLIAREGLSAIASNIAAAGSNSPTPKPLDPVAPPLPDNPPTPLLRRPLT